MRYRQQIEDYLAKKVETMLAQVIGPGNAVVRVSAEIETDATTQTEEKYDPEGQVVRSQTITEDTTNTTESRTGGVVGVTANVPGQEWRERCGQADLDKRTEPEEPHDHLRDQSHHHQHRAYSGRAQKPHSSSVYRATDARRRRPGRQADGRGTRLPPAARHQRPGCARHRRTVARQHCQPARDAFPDTGISAQVAQIQKETRVATWIESASRYVAVGVALAVLALFWRMLRQQKPEPVPVELLTESHTNAQRGMPARGQSRRNC